MSAASSLAPTRHRKPIAIAGIVLILLASLSVFLITNWNRARETANRSKCKKQMSALGQAIFLYANEYRGAQPPTLKELIVSQDITPEIFI
jgi:hypothetical protein